MEMENKKELKAGAWEDGSITAYPEVIKFETDKPHRVKFDEDFEKPLELPQKDKAGVFYVFNCEENGERKSIMTSSVTLLAGLKKNMPLANKEVEITKKNVAGKNYFYLSVIGEKPIIEEDEDEEVDFTAD